MKVSRRMRLRTTIVTLLSGACGGGRLPPHMAALRSVCDEVQQGGYRPPKQFDVGHCDGYSIGNWLSVYYALVAVADVNSTIDMTCQSTEPPHLAFPPRVRGQGSFDPRAFCTKSVCQLYPHVCPHPLPEAIPFIHFHMWYHARHSGLYDETMSEEVVIHFRCAADVVLERRPDYGIMQFADYERAIPPDAAVIRILSPPEKRCSRGSSAQCTVASDLCGALRRRLADRITAVSPRARLVDDHESSVATTLVRLTMARVTFCASSTFCLFPALAARHGVIAKSSLNRWVAANSSYLRPAVWWQHRPRGRSGHRLLLDHRERAASAEGSEGTARVVDLIALNATNATARRWASLSSGSFISTKIDAAFFFFFSFFFIQFASPGPPGRPASGRPRSSSGRAVDLNDILTHHDKCARRIGGVPGVCRIQG